jgi:hypothetical protein
MTRFDLSDGHFAMPAQENGSIILLSERQSDSDLLQPYRE